MLWMRSAITSFPLPDSPCSSTGASERAIRHALSMTPRMVGPRPATAAKAATAEIGASGRAPRRLRGGAQLESSSACPAASRLQTNGFSSSSTEKGLAM